jgi:beta-N-acetylhexosaminidase
MLDQPNVPTQPENTIPPSGTLEPTPAPTFKIGDSLPLITGIIIDHNGNPVPDGTVVRFSFTIGGDTVTAQQSEAVTSQGSARVQYPVQIPGLLEIRVNSDPAFTSEVLQLDIAAGESAGITAIAPTTNPTQTSLPTFTSTVGEKTTPTPIPPPVEVVNPADWLLAMIVIWGCGSGIYWIGRRSVNLRWGIRWGLMAVIGGLVVFLYLAIGLPGSPEWLQVAGRAGQILAIFSGIMLGWLGGLSWRQVMQRHHRR